MKTLKGSMDERDIQYEEGTLLPAIDDRAFCHKKCGTHLTPVVGNVYFCDTCQCEVELRVKRKHGGKKADVEGEVKR